MYRKRWILLQGNEEQHRLRELEMEKLRQEKAAYARKSTSIRTRVIARSEGERSILKKERELRKRFTETIKNDKKNAEVLYRYGFFLMDRGEYSKAIRRFEEALDVNERRDCSFPLEKAQMLKAHMFIGFCAGQLLKQSLEKAESLNIEDTMFDYDLNVEGKSLEDVLQMLKKESEHYVAIINGEKRIISLNEYLQYKGGSKGKVLLISFVETDVTIKMGNYQAKKVPEQSSELLRYMLDMILKKGYVTYDDVRFDFGSTLSWDTLRRNVNRTYEYIDTKESVQKVFELSKGTFSEQHPQSYQLATTNYIIVFRQSTFLELDNF